MKANFKLNFLNTLAAKKNSEKGFTLIELLVVVIIIGVLAAIALPNLLSQVSKGRQSEAKNNLGAVNRAQQAYRLEEATFGKIDDLPVKIGGTFYDYDDIGTVFNKNQARHQAIAKEDYEDDLLDYGAAVYQGADGTFQALICEAPSVDGNTNAVTGNVTATNDDLPGCGSFDVVN